MYKNGESIFKREMEAVPVVKREREEEEDTNQRDAKALKNSDEVKSMEVIYTMMKPEDRRKLYGKQFNLLPKDWQRVIAKTTPGTLMLMARTSKMFAELARMESIWKHFFERDFPREWKFCGGELPFFVLTDQHIFYLEGDNTVEYEDKTAWKRFYLNTAYDYRRFARTFTLNYGKMLADHGNVPGLNFKWARAVDIYNWVQRVPLGMHFDQFDFKASLAWKFVQLMTVVIVRPEGNLSSPMKIAAYYLSYAMKYSHRHWMLPYLGYSNPHGVGVSYTFDDEEFNQGSEIYGPDALTLWARIDSGERHEEVADFWYKWQKVSDRPHFASSRGANLFSKQDYLNLQSLLESLSTVSSRPGFEGLSDEEISTRKESIYKCWEMFETCFHNPCIYSLPTLTRGMNVWASYVEDCHMIIPQPSSKNVQDSVTSVIHDGNYATWQNDDFESKLMLPFTRNDWVFPDVDSHNKFVQICRPFSVFHRRQLGENYDDAADYYGLVDLFQKYAKNPRKEFGSDESKIRYIDTCLQCGTVPVVPQQCGGTCQDTIYCNQDCQRAHWAAGHKNECGRKK